jgi:hypothetical protein
MHRLFLCTVFLSVSLPLFADAVKPKPLENPPERTQIVSAIGRGVNFLLEQQNPNGSWGSARRTKQLNIYAPGSSHDAYRAGTTALDLTALLEVEAALKRKNSPFTLTELGVDEGKFNAAITLAEQWMFDNLPKLRRSADDCLYNIWGHSYGIQTLVRMLHRFPDDSERGAKIKELIAQQVDMLRRFETLSGGWFYYDDNKTAKPSETTASFCSATGLIALKEAQNNGIEVPQKLVDKTMASLKRQRLPDFSYLYGEYLWQQPRRGINRPAGSLGRSQACNLAMKQWGDNDITNETLIVWLDRLYARNGWLDVGRKRPIPHESFFQIAGYFFYYAHYYAALCIEEIPERDRRIYKEFLADVLVGLQENDGSWWDYPLYDYHQPYGTGFAVQSLLRTL